MTEYQILTKKLLEKRAELSKELSNSFHGLFQEFFKNYPEIAYVTWTQYTPYFNDGDECTFSVHERAYPLTKLVGNEEPEDRPYGYDAEEFELETSTYYTKRPDFIDENQIKAGISNERATEIKSGIDSLEDVLGEIPEEVYKDVFDDHVYVIVDREGIHTEEYNHY
jgi:hypothetical protein